MEAGTEMERLTAMEFEAADGVADWRVIGGRASAWFRAGSLSAGAVLVGHIASLVDGNVLPDVDLRSSGLRVQIGATAPLDRTDVALAQVISSAARDQGLTADPAALQRVQLVIDDLDRPSVMSFWQNVCDYQPFGDDGLSDAARRDPPISFRHRDDPRPLRHRIHVDVVRPADQVMAVKAAVGAEAFGVYQLTLADADGNEVDLVPGDPLSDGPETADWRVVFGAMAFYPTASPGQAWRLAAAAARLADESGVALLVDLRPDGITLDSGKDEWEEDGKPPGETRFAELARRIQTAAHKMDLTADPTRLRFVQLAFDAVDVAAVRGFWTGLLGYQPDPRTDLTDIVDARRLNPVIMFQDMDPADQDRRQQRNRIHLNLAVPRDQLSARIDAAVAAGGRVVSTTEGRAALTDLEGNEVDIVTDR